jgi:NAD+ diphosphatase
VRRSAIARQRNGVPPVVREAMMDQLAPYLPFNRESLGGEFIPAKNGDLPESHHGTWLLVREQALLIQQAVGGPGWRLPQSPLPEGLARTLHPIIHLGTYKGAPCWAAAVPQGVHTPTGFRWECVVPRETRLTDDALSLGGLALQAIHWEQTSLYCPRCGAATARIREELGKRCSQCSYEHYAHLHPAVIVLVRDRDRVLLTRKAFWPKGRYGLVAGFVDVGESLEGAVEREVHEEVGVDIRDLRYVGSQYWPFPSQLMVGFTAAYAGGALVVNTQELEDARWFSVLHLPELPPKLSIARFLIDHFARSDEKPGVGTDESGGSAKSK